MKKPSRSVGAFILAVAVITFAPNAFIVQAANVTADTQNSSQTDEIAALNQKIAGYQEKLKELGSSKASLQNSLDTLGVQMDQKSAQISLVKQQIRDVESQIQSLGSQASSAEDEIATDQKALAEEIRSMAETDDDPLILKILSSGNFSEAWNDLYENKEIQNSLQENTIALQAQKNNLLDTQNSIKQKQSVLAYQNSSLSLAKVALAQTQASKTELLKETNSQESQYQELLKNAQDQLKSFSQFTENAGGSGLLSNQTSCDAWGCYYNQRDAEWGNDPLNGTQYRLASDGCLITAMAMVLTHYGYRNVTPLSINAVPSNFAAYYPSFLMKTIQAGGVSATRVSADIDTTLAGGDPVIVGLHAYGGTHFVVLVSGSNGNYVMRDPYIANGKDISFSAHYSVGSIYEINKVEID